MGAQEPLNPATVAQAMFDQDRASQSLGMRIESVEVGKAVMTMTVTPEMVNGLEVCHGGFLFTLADSAMAFASNAANSRAFASQAEIDFVNPASLGTELTATATQIVERGRLGVHDVTIRDEHHETIAVFRGRTITVGGDVVPPDPAGVSRS